MTLCFPDWQTFHRFRGTRRTGKQDASRLRPPFKTPLGCAIFIRLWLGPSLS